MFIFIFVAVVINVTIDVTKHQMKVIWGGKGWSLVHYWMKLKLELKQDTDLEEGISAEPWSSDAHD